VAEKKFLDFLDRFDGGGMGKSGEKFEGGGLLSMLGNLFADPYGSDDKARMASRDAFYNAQGDAVPAPTLLAPKAGKRAAPAAMNNNQAVSARPTPPTDAQRFGMNPPAPYSASPVNVGAPPSYMQPRSMQTPVNYGDGSGMTPANNYVDSFANDPFSYNGNRTAGMAGNAAPVPFVDPTMSLDADIARDLPTSLPDVEMFSPRSGNPFVDPTMSLDADIVRDLPTGLPDVEMFSPRSGSPFERFSSQLVGMLGERSAQTLMDSSVIDSVFQAFLNNNQMVILKDSEMDIGNSWFKPKD